MAPTMRENLPYVDSGAVLALMSERGLAVARETLRDLGFAHGQVERKIGVSGSRARGQTPAHKPAATGLVYMENLLGDLSLFTVVTARAR